MAAIRKKLCQTGSDLLDKGEAIVNGIEYLLNNKAGQQLVEKAGDDVKEALDQIRSFSTPGIRVSRSLFDEIDKVLEGPLCKRASRTKKRDAGIAEMKRLFNAVGRDKAFSSVCSISNTVITILKEVLRIANKIISSGIAKLAIEGAATLAAGPAAGAAAVVTINQIIPKATQTVQFAGKVQKFICDDLRKALKNA